MEYEITQQQIDQYRLHLLREEYAAYTAEKYIRDIRRFAVWLGAQPAKKERAAEWKDCLLKAGYAPVTVNSMLSALNGFFHFLGWDVLRVKFLKIQRRMFREPAKELSRHEYNRLFQTASRGGKGRLALLMETICATGIRVSEVRYITVEAVRARRSEVALKGKMRTILLPGRLCRKLLDYAKRAGIEQGEIFLTSKGKGLTRGQICSEMKALCEKSGVEASKVYPHNLRHLFARAFYRVTRDVVQLADVLGHSNVETTRIYLISTGSEHERQLERLGLVT